MTLHGEQGYLPLLVSHVHNPFNIQHVVKKVWRVPLDASIGVLREQVNIYVAHKELLHDYKQSVRFVRLCRQLHFFITRLYADSDTNSLVYSFGRASRKLQQLYSMLTYWRSMDANTYQQFYALYFSAVARLLVAHIQSTYESMDTDRYASDYSQVEQHVGELIRIKKLLIGSEHERRCAQQLSRYHELVVLLQCAYKERRGICEE